MYISKVFGNEDTIYRYICIKELRSAVAMLRTIVFSLYADKQHESVTDVVPITKCLLRSSEILVRRRQT